MQRLGLILILVLFSIHSTMSPAASHSRFNIQQIAQLHGVPWGMTILPDGKLLITLRHGQLIQLDPDTGEKIEINGLPKDIFTGGQAGLFDVKLSPDYLHDHYIYLSYSKNIAGQGATTLAKARLDQDLLSHWQDVIVTQSSSPTRVHFGGRIAFDMQGHVFLSVGERGVRLNAQNLGNHAGSVLRLNLDGSIPSDNPFVDIEGVMPEIWSYGHRNPQGLFYNPDTQQLWEAEHGPRGGDEINLIKKGQNYGWPVISYGMEYDRPFPVGKGTHQKGMAQPVYYYVPSIASSSIIQYRGKAFPGWQGNLLIGALKLQHVNRIILDKQNRVIKEERLFSDLNARIRNIIESPEGWLYLSTDRGQIIQIQPNNKEKP